MSKATKWRKVGPKRWCRGPLRVYASLHGTRWFVGVMRSRVIEDIEDPAESYATPEEAMRRADKWVKEIARLVRKMEGGK